MRYSSRTITPVGKYRRHRFVSLLTLLPLLFSLLLPASTVNAETPSRLQSLAESPPAVVIHTFSAPDPRISTEDDGYSAVELEGFPPTGLPGDPGLPSALFYVALPPQVPLDSVTMEISAATQTELPGTYQIAPFGPYIKLQERDSSEDWGPSAAAIVDGKNTVTYGADTYFPAEPIELVIETFHHDLYDTRAAKYDRCAVALLVRTLCTDWDDLPGRASGIASRG